MHQSKFSTKLQIKKQPMKTKNFQNFFLHTFMSTMIDLVLLRKIITINYYLVIFGKVRHNPWYLSLPNHKVQGQYGKLVAIFT